RLDSRFAIDEHPVARYYFGKSPRIIDASVASQHREKTRLDSSHCPVSYDVFYFKYEFGFLIVDESWFNPVVSPLVQSRGCPRTLARFCRLASRALQAQPRSAATLPCLLRTHLIGHATRSTLFPYTTLSRSAGCTRASPSTSTRRPATTPARRCATSTQP